MNLSTPNKARKISLFLSDVDGTLLTKDKILTESSKQAVTKIYQAGIKFSITSSRSLKGMAYLIDQLQISSPIGAFNGAIFAMPDLTILKKRTLADSVTQNIVKVITQHGLDVWLFQDNDWFVSSKENSHVSREESISKVAPNVIDDCLNLDKKLTQNIAKIVGVSDNFEAVAACELDLQNKFSQQANSHRSQTYFLDITHPDANKGSTVRMLADYFAIGSEEIATIGDMFNDVAMFKQSGLSIAMGNAGPEVQKQAQYITETNQEEGFAKAVERYILNN